MPTATAPGEIPTVPPPAPPPEEHVPEMGGSQHQRRRRCDGQDEDGDLWLILRRSYEKTKVIGKVVRYTNILGGLVPDLVNEHDKLIDTGQIIIAQKLLECKNDIHVTMVSWGHCVTSKDGYTLFCAKPVTLEKFWSQITKLVVIKRGEALNPRIPVTYLGFEYRSVHDGDRIGFTVKPTATYVDECLNIVQLQHAKAVMTPLTEQKSLNLHCETTACGQVQHSLFDFRDKMFVLQTCVTNTCRFDTCQESVEEFERNTRTESLSDDTCIETK